jgi:hypothetical protein
LVSLRSFAAVSSIAALGSAYNTAYNNAVVRERHIPSPSDGQSLNLLDIATDIRRQPTSSGTMIFVIVTGTSPVLRALDRHRAHEPALAA